MVVVIAPELYEPKLRYRTKKRDNELRERADIDPAIIAEELGLTERYVLMYQRKLGMREVKQKRRKADPD